jgi:hypothetical protein
VYFRLGEVWLGSMPNARKAQDLIRDGRFALHVNPGAGTDMDGGDVRIAGRAVLVEDPAVIARFVDEVRPPEPFHLFRLEIGEVVRVFIEGEEIVVLSWHPGGGLRTQRRRGDDSPVRDG